MVFNFLFKKKKDKENEQVAPTKENKKNLSLEDKIETELNSLPGYVKKYIDKDPSIKEKFIAIAKRMRAEGVDLNSPTAVKRWIRQHEKELKKEQQEKQGKVETIVKEKEPGRNDPCPCGSGKKYKKCCGANK